MTAPTTPDKTMSFQSVRAIRTRRTNGRSAAPGITWIRNAIARGETAFRTSFESVGQIPKRTAATMIATYPRVLCGRTKNHRTENGANDLEIPQVGRLKAAPGVLFSPGLRGCEEHRGRCAPRDSGRRLDGPPSRPEILRGPGGRDVSRDEPPTDSRQPHARPAATRSNRILRSLTWPRGRDRRRGDGDGPRGLDRPAVPRTRRGAGPRHAAEGTALPAAGERGGSGEGPPNAVPLRLPQGELSLDLVPGRHAVAPCGRDRMGHEAPRRKESGPRLLRGWRDEHRGLPRGDELCRRVQDADRLPA